jgi:hypothetical protein
VSANGSTGALLEVALGYASAGRAVFPVGRNKMPLVPKAEGGRGYLDATKDQQTIRECWTKWPDAGIATPTGPNWFALDIDDEEALNLLIAEHGPLPPTVEVVTPRPGRHVYLRGATTNSPGRLPAGLHVRGQGGCVLLPPSPHQDGVYEWRTAPDESDIAPAPEWLIDLLRSSSENGTAQPVDGDIPQQQRNDTLASLAGTMRRRGLHENAIAAALLATNADRCVPPLSDAEVRKIAHSVSRYQPTASAVSSLDDLNTLLGLTDVGRRIDRVSIYGRGTKGIAHLHLDDGERIVLDPLGSYTTVPKLTAELALQAGAAPALKGPAVQKVLVLLRLLGEHHELHELSDQASEHGVEYLRGAAIAEFQMNDQASRWRAFSRLDTAVSQDIVLQDTETGLRYVRIGWFEQYVRTRTSPGVPDQVVRSMSALGWSKPGREGRIKATAPGRPDRLTWAFFVIPIGWEDA